MTRLLLVLVFVLGNWPFTVRGDDRESEARRLFVEAAKLRHSAPCEEIGFTENFVELTLLLGWAFGSDDSAKITACLKQFKEAATIHQRIINEFPETEAAFTLASQGYQTPKQVDNLLEAIETQKGRYSASASPKVEDLMVGPRSKAHGKTPPVPKRRPIAAMDESAVGNTRTREPARLSSILRNVEKIKDHPSPIPEDPATEELETGPVRPQVSAVQQNEMIRAIQQQVSRCWRFDPGAREAEDLIVEIRVLLNTDGSVRRADVVDVARMVQDAYFRSAAENAKRAIDACSPFRLPLREYDVWRDLTLRFNPREMFGT